MILTPLLIDSEAKLIVLICFLNVTYIINDFNMYIMTDGNLSIKIFEGFFCINTINRQISDGNTIDFHWVKMIRAWTPKFEPSSFKCHQHRLSNWQIKIIRPGIHLHFWHVFSLPFVYLIILLRNI